MSLPVILFLSLLTLAALRLAMPRRLRDVIGPAEIGAALLLPIIGTFSPFYLVFTAAIAVIIGYVPRLSASTPSAVMEQRMRLLFFCLPLLPLAQETLMVSTFTIMQVNYTVLLCAAAGIAMYSAGLRVPTARLATWDLTFALMMAIQLFMDARSSDATFFIRAVLQVILTLGLPYFVISRAFATVRQPARLLIALLVATAIVAVAAFYESYRHWLLYETISNNIGSGRELVSGYSKMRGGMLRARGTFPESTGMSLFFSVNLVLLFALRRHIGSLQVVLLLAVMITTGLFATFARVGYIAVAVGLCLSLLYERRFWTLMGLLVGLPFIVLGMMAVGEVLPVVGAAIGTGQDSVGSVDYRSQLMDAGLEIVRQNWLFGLSVEAIMARLENLRQGEGIIDLVNEPLTIMMRAGIIGGLCYFLMTFRVVIQLFLNRARMDAESRVCAAACFASILGLLMGLTTTSFGRNQTTLIVLLAVGAGLMARIPRRVQNSAANTVLPSNPAASPATAVPSMINS